MAGSRHERCANRSLEFADSDRHGGLTQTQLRCSLRDAAEPGDRYEMHAVAAMTRFA